MSDLATKYTDSIHQLEALRAELTATGERYGAADGMRAQAASRAADAVANALGALNVSGGVNVERLARLN